LSADQIEPLICDAIMTMTKITSSFLNSFQIYRVIIILAMSHQNGKFVIVEMVTFVPSSFNPKRILFQYGYEITIV
jgi:hypothetical protein